MKLISRRLLTRLLPTLFGIGLFGVFTQTEVWDSLMSYMGIENDAPLSFRVVFVPVLAAIFFRAFSDYLFTHSVISVTAKTIFARKSNRVVVKEPPDQSERAVSEDFLRAQFRSVAWLANLNVVIAIVWILSFGNSDVLKVGLLLLSLFIFALTRFAILQYRVMNGYFGLNGLEARLLLEFIVKEYSKDDTGGGGGPRRALLPEKVIENEMKQGLSGREFV